MNDQGQSGRSGRDENTNASTTDMIISENFEKFLKILLYEEIFTNIVRTFK